MRIETYLRGENKMARPKRNTEPITISLTLEVHEILSHDSERFGIGRGAYISQLIMQKHMEMIATGLLEKLTPEQIQMAIAESQTKI